MINSFSEDLPNTQSLTKEHLTLIKTKYRSKSLINVVRRSKIRNSVTAIEFDKNYQLFIYKINLIKDTSLKKVLVITPKIEAKEELRVTYKLDSLITYGLVTNNLSIHYKENGIADIIVKGKEQNLGNSVTMPIEVLFLKRKSSVFFLTLIAKNVSDTIPPNLLYNIVTNQ